MTDKEIKESLKDIGNMPGINDLIKDKIRDFKNIPKREQRFILLFFALIFIIISFVLKDCSDDISANEVPQHIKEMREQMKSKGLTDEKIFILNKGQIFDFQITNYNRSRFQITSTKPYMIEVYRNNKKVMSKVYPSKDDDANSFLNIEQEQVTRVISLEDKNTFYYYGQNHSGLYYRISK